MNPWHDVDLGEAPYEAVTAIIEIPRLSRTKYEICKKTGMILIDRVMSAAVHYPANYGFLPKTYCDDKDPLDILVIGDAEAVPLSIMQARPIGVMKMIDGGEGDDKIIAVHADDPSVKHVQKMEDLPAHTIAQIKNFFEIYKTLEKKQVEIKGFGDKAEALKIIKESVDLYEANKAMLKG